VDDVVVVDAALLVVEVEEPAAEDEVEVVDTALAVVDVEVPTAVVLVVEATMDDVLDFHPQG
jgi:hypothetical protein